MHTAKLAAELNAVFKKAPFVAKMREQYDHIKLPFTDKEVQSFLDDKPSPKVGKYGVTRNHQVDQTISVLGAYFVDRKMVLPSTRAAYKAAWQVTVDKKCPYCKRTFTMKVMFKQGYCHNARCQLSAMRDAF